MKLFFKFLILTMIFSCTSQQKELKPTWLIGKWERMNNKPNTQTYEFWNSDLSGIGVTLKEKDTTFKEILHIIHKNDSLFLKVTGVNESPTLFAFTQQNDTSFTAENRKNEFPKVIQYWISDKFLNAKVSNEKFSIDFTFKEIN